MNHAKRGNKPKMTFKHLKIYTNEKNKLHSPDRRQYRR